MIAMADKVSIVIDAGHGGQDPGAVFQGREEKTDTLRLALAVGQILTENGMDVSYTRVTDRYHTPGEKAEMANYQDSDYFLSIHRNAMPVPGTASGIQTLIYDNGGAAQLMASEINKKLTEMGWKDLGVMERPGLIVLRKTKMPAVLVEVGFINSDVDNELFDSHFYDIAQAIAEGILDTLEVENAPSTNRYKVQTGAFRNEVYANNLKNELTEMDFPARVEQSNGFFRVMVGNYGTLDEATAMEKR